MHRFEMQRAPVGSHPMASRCGDGQVGTVHFEVDARRVHAGNVDDEFQRIHVLLAAVMRLTERGRAGKGR